MFDGKFPRKSAVQNFARNCYPKKNQIGLPIKKTLLKIVPQNSVKKMLLEK